MQKLSEELQLVVFRLGKEEFGVDISQVKEIIKIQEITKIPNSPPFIEGVINLRGAITPVMDLRKRLGIPAGETDENGRIIVVEMGKGTVGAIVDSVAEVLRLPGKNIDAAPGLTASIDSNYVRGVGKLEDRLLILLDLNKILDEDEIGGINAF